jgi:hypothetical protein
MLVQSSRLRGRDALRDSANSSVVILAFDLYQKKEFSHKDVPHSGDAGSVGK